MRKSLFLLVFAAFAPIYAQTTNCTVGTAKNFLDTNDVRARMNNDGSLFSDPAGKGYLPLKNQTIDAIYNTSLWVGGYVNNELRVTGATYANYEFAPGALDENGKPPANCDSSNRIWKVSKSDLQAFDPKNPNVYKDIAEWPWYWGAPVKDGDGNKSNYNLEAGDRPAIEGTQSLWWVMNDVASEHLKFKTKPLGLEVQVMAFAENNPASPITNRTTFYRYTFINKSKDTIRNFMAGYFIDSDMGNASDDLVGTDSTLNMIYTYNRDNDDGSDFGFGKNLPAMGFVLLKGLNEKPNRSKMYSAWSPVKGVNNYAFSDAPQNAQEAYYRLMGRGSNGEFMRIGGALDQQLNATGAITRFQYPSDLPSYWSMENIDGQQTQHPIRDMRMMFSTGGNDLAPNQKATVFFAIHTTFDIDRLMAVQNLKKEVKAISQFAPNTYFVAKEDENHELPNAVFELLPHFPNPANQSSQVAFSLAKTTTISLSLYDVLGREVKNVLNETRNSGQHQIEVKTADLPNGVYVYRLSANGQTQTKRLVVQH